MLELILLGAILGGFLTVLAYQLTKMLIAKQVPLNDLDAVIKALFELDFDKAFWIKIVIGTVLGAGGAFLSLNALVAGIPVGADTTGLIVYGLAWGFAGNGILYIVRMVPQNVLTILNLNNKLNTLKAKVAGLEEQNLALSKLSGLVQPEQTAPLK